MRLRIEKAIYGGAGLARAEGQAVFVPFTLPGEIVEAEIVEQKGGFATAELHSVVEPSPSRTRPPCPYFCKCGGCHYQHAGYSAQVEMKVTILRETLERAHIRDIPEIAVVTGEPFGYRNRIRLHVRKNPFGLCYKLRNSRVDLPVMNCPVAAPLLQRAIEVLTREGPGLELAEYVTEMELFANQSESEMLLSLWTIRSTSDAKRFLDKVSPSLRQMLPEMSGAGMYSSGNGRIPGRLLAVTGADAMQYSAAGWQYRVGFACFFQVNRFLIDPLVQLVAEGESGDTAWDLYAGIGLFSLNLAKNFAETTAVESSATAIRYLRENLRGTKHRVVAAETAAFLRRAVQQRQAAPDLLVVDPPRAGLGRDVTTALEKLRPRKITYVSCDPATLSRDLALLLESGYRLRKMHLLDLFPQTFHLESVTHLTLD